VGRRNPAGDLKSREQPANSSTAKGIVESTAFRSRTETANNMRWKQIEAKPKVFALIFETGDEVLSGLQRFSKEQGLAGSSFKAIGALSYAKLGWFNWETKKYQPAVVLDEQVELLSMIGDIALKDGEPQVHAHVVVGRSDGTAHGGHLIEARVRPTCELILTESSTQLQKKIDPESGIALIQI